VTRVEHHPTDGHLLYAGWALPGTAESTAGWRIVKFVWDGPVLDHYEWADGDDLLDNVWADRAALTYDEAEPLSLEAAGRADLTVSIPAPATTFDLGIALSGTIEVRLSGLWMSRVTSGPDGDEFATAGTEIELGVTALPGQRLLVRVWL
jgi:hypothetical protein